MCDTIDNSIYNSILKNNNPRTYYKLCYLISKFVHKNDIYTFLYKLFKNKKSDTQIYYDLKPYVKKQNESSNYLIYLADHFKNLITTYKHRDINRYLDYGCGNCNTTYYLGSALNLKKNQIYGTDVSNIFEHEWSDKRNENITFKFIKNNILPFDGKFDVITALMVLHHIENPEPIIKQLCDKLNKGGVLIIKEHNCTNDSIRMFCDLIHHLFYLGSDRDIKDIINKKYYYKSASEWKKLIEINGLKEVYYYNIEMSVTNNYEAVYIK